MTGINNERPLHGVHGVSPSAPAKPAVQSSGITTPGSKALPTKSIAPAAAPHTHSALRQKGAVTSPEPGMKMQGAPRNAGERVQAQAAPETALAGATADPKSGVMGLQVKKEAPKAPPVPPSVQHALKNAEVLKVAYELLGKAEESEVSINELQAMAQKVAGALKVSPKNTELQFVEKELLKHIKNPSPKVELQSVFDSVREKFMGASESERKKLLFSPEGNQLRELLSKNPEDSAQLLRGLNHLINVTRNWAEELARVGSSDASAMSERERNKVPSLIQFAKAFFTPGMTPPRPTKLVPPPPPPRPSEVAPSAKPVHEGRPLAFQGTLESLRRLEKQFVEGTETQRSVLMASSRVNEFKKLLAGSPGDKEKLKAALGAPIKQLREELAKEGATASASYGANQRELSNRVLFSQLFFGPSKPLK